MGISFGTLADLGEARYSLESVILGCFTAIQQGPQTLARINHHISSKFEFCPKNPAANQFPDVFRASLATRHRQKPIFPIRQGSGGHF